jgi:tetratricopeptide (TPR) repeat protein
MKNKNLLVAGAVIAGLATLMILSDRPVSGVDGSEIIRDGDGYVKANQEVSNIALSLFEKADSGKELSEEDRDNLRKAAVKFEAMRGYNPTQVSTNFGAGKCYMLVGDLQKAVERFEQAYYNRLIDPQKDDLGVKSTVIESECLIAECLVEMAAYAMSDSNSASQSGDSVGAKEALVRAETYRQKALQYANEAVTAQPNGVRYLAARGSAYLALKKLPEAKLDILKAHKLAPDDFRVKLLAQLVGITK